METYDRLVEKWAPVLNEESAGVIKDSHRKAVTAVILENQERAFQDEAAQANMLTEAAPGNATSSAANWNPVLISLVRRALPNMMAYDVCGVQPMTGPTGLIFAMKARYGSGATGSTEALYAEANTTWAGDSGTAMSASGPSGLSGLTDDSTASSGVAGSYNLKDSSIDNERVGPVQAGGMATASAEGLGSTGQGPSSTFNEMGFTIEKATVTAKSRALKAEYSLELAQDLKAIHGLDAETELANILSTEILAEINREVIRTINAQAKTGASTNNTAINGIFDLSTDADGRWSIERLKGLIMQIEREANQIAKDTRRGKGNFIICSSDVASGLAASGMLDYAPAMSTNLNVDDTGNLFAGVLNGNVKIFIDPYALDDIVTVVKRKRNKLTVNCS